MFPCRWSWPIEVSPATTTVVMTLAARSRLLSRFAVDPRRVVVIPHGAHENRSLPGERYAAAQPTVLTWGLLGPGKGIEMGIDAIALADQLIRAGEFDCIVAGGMESMTQAPYLLPGARAGYRLGDNKVIDSMMYDGLTCAFDDCAMGLGTDRYNQKLGITRERQDAFSAGSHAKAAAAIADGRMAEEIVAVAVPQRKGDPIMVTTDEGVRVETDFASLEKLRPAFDKEGSITAGNASQISDGACAVVVMSKKKAEELGISGLGELLAFGEVAGPDASLLTQPARAIKKALAKTDLTLDDIDLFELNEAFACVGLASADDLGIDEEKINVNGGAIALGHPLGMSGARVALTALYELKRRGGGVAAVALCGGGGQGDAAILRSL